MEAGTIAAPPTTLRYTPCPGMVLVDLHDSRTTKGGLLLPEGSMELDYHRATVVAVGQGRYLEGGVRAEAWTKVGDVVILPKAPGIFVPSGGEDEYGKPVKYLLLPESHCYAVEEGACG